MVASEPGMHSGCAKHSAAVLRKAMDDDHRSAEVVGAAFQHVQSGVVRVCPRRRPISAKLRRANSGNKTLSSSTTRSQSSPAERILQRPDRARAGRVMQSCRRRAALPSRAQGGSNARGMSCHKAWCACRSDVQTAARAFSTSSIARCRQRGCCAAADARSAPAPPQSGGAQCFLIAATAPASRLRVWWRRAPPPGALAAERSSPPRRRRLRAHIRARWSNRTRLPRVLRRTGESSFSARPHRRAVATGRAR